MVRTDRDTSITVLLGVLAIGGGIFLYWNKKNRQSQDANAAKFIQYIKTNLNPEAVKMSAFGTGNKGPANSKKLSQAQADAYAKQIHGAWGVFDDDEDAVRQVLRALKSREQVSQVAAAYERLYKSQMLSDFEYYLLDDWTTSSDYYEFEKLVNSKPLYV